MDEPKDLLPATIYHYTDLNALLSIIRAEHIQLRATHYRFLNDPAEFEIGRRIISERYNIEIPTSQYDNCFLTSFSSESDSLNLWNIYADNSQGFSIGFDTNTLLSSNSSAGATCAQCFYGEEAFVEWLDRIVDKNITMMQTQFANAFEGKGLSEEQRKSLTTVLCKILSNIGIHRNPSDYASVDECKKLAKELINIVLGHLVKSFVAVKHKCYEFEKEVRIAYLSNSNSQILFKAKNGIAIPFIERTFSKDALKCIVIGPTNKSDIIKESLEYLLKTRGYDLSKIQIISSQVPYRG